MSDIQRISKNSFYSFLSIFFRLFSNVILFWLVARFYGKEIFGQFTIAQTFASVYVIFADFGLDMLLTIELPKKIREPAKIFRSFLSIKFVLSVFAFFVMITAALVSDFSSDVQLLIIIFSFYAAFTTLTNFLYAFFKGNERLEYETKVSFFVNTTSLIVILLLIILDQSIIIIAISFVVMRFLGLLTALRYTFQLLPSISYRFDFSQFKEIWNAVLIFGLFLVFGNLYFQLDTIILAYLTDEASVGIYQAVFRLIMLPLIIPTIFINSIMPALSRFNSVDLSKWEKLGYILNKFLVIVAIPITIILFVHAEIIIDIIYGLDEYGSAVPILKVFAIIVFIRFFAETFGLMLTTSNRQKIRMSIVVFATLFNLIANLVLIPKYGIWGAAVISLATNLIVAILFIIAMKEFSFKWILETVNLLLALLIILVVFSTYLIYITDLWYMSFLVVILYFILIYKYYLSNEEKKYIRDLNFIRRS